jgi:5-methyltetrahydrofolate--homocysteine methyltransferase
LIAKRSHILAGIYNAILNGEVNSVVQYVHNGLKMSMSTEEILTEAIVPASQQLVQQFQGADFYIPDVLLAARAIKASLHALKPKQTPSAHQAKRVLIGTVEGDIHDIGKHMVKLFFEFAGFQVTDLGVDVPAYQFVEAVKKYKPDILAVSALLTTTMGEMSKIIDMLYIHNVRQSVKVLVGGGPVTAEFAQLIGADAYAESAYDSVNTALKLLSR